MKPKECSKYVYQRSGIDFIRLDSSGHVLSVDFVNLYRVFYYSIPGSYEPKKIHFLHNGRPALAWRDKHNNIVVRVFHEDTQTSLNL